MARRFDISVKRVVRLEKTGLKRLRSLAKGGGCAPPSSGRTSDTVTFGVVPPATRAAAMATPAAKDRTSKNGKGDRGQSGAGTGTSDDDTSAGGVDAAPERSRGGVAGVTQTNLPGSSNGGFSLTIPLIVLALALTALLLARRLRRDHPTPATVTEPGPDPEPQRAPWVPWHKSTLTGPGWNEPPESGTEDTWNAPENAAAPDEPEHEPWSPPRSRTRH